MEPEGRSERRDTGRLRSKMDDCGAAFNVGEREEERGREGGGVGPEKECTRKCFQD